MSSTAAAPCKHTQWTTLKAVNPDTGVVTSAKMCTDCGHQWHTKHLSVPTSYQRRLVQVSPKGVRYPATPDHLGGGWKTEWFGTNLQPKTLKDAKARIAKWNQSCIDSGMLVEYRLDLDLKCSKCDKRVHETYAGNTCVDCHMADIKPKPIPVTNFSNQFNSPLKKPVLLKREEGEIWEIPASSSPLWTKQWGYQGSAKEPYIVSKKNKIDGGTSPDGWACSCRGFTQHTPRRDCKHIINIKHQYGGTVNPTKHAVANLDSEEAAAFAEFKRQQAANAKQKPTSGDADLLLWGNVGRKFR